MNSVTRSWLRKAEGDFLAAQRLLEHWSPRCADAVCFHNQQAVEKFLKACLVEAGLPFPRTRDLPTILNLLAKIDPMWKAFEVACDQLTKHSVNIRYPGSDATKRDALRTSKISTSSRREARLALGLKA